MKQIILGFSVLILVAACSQPDKDVPALSMDHLEEDFVNPPDHTRPGCYWYWINDNISQEGLTKDLEAMARVGIGRAYIGHIFNYSGNNSTPIGKVQFNTEAWWEAVQWAVREAGRLGIEIGFFNSPGWSQSGGPWIKPEQSMRYLAHSETTVTGGQEINQILPIPEIHTFPNAGGSSPIQTGANFTKDDFQDVRVIAFEQSDFEAHDINMNQVRILAPQLDKPDRLIDQSKETSIVFPAHQEIVIDFDLQEVPEEIREIQSLSIQTNRDRFFIRCFIESSEDGQNYQEVSMYSEERGHQGPKRKEAVFVPFPPTRSPHLRFTFISNAPVAISELTLSRQARLGRYVRKQLAETSPSTNPPWQAYQWEEQMEPTEHSSLLSTEVIDLSGKMDDSGRLIWEAPAGNWVIMRMGMIPIGTQNAPSSPESRGLEVDKMSQEHVASLFEGMVGEFLRKTPAQDRQALKYVIADSYETGPQNWTDGFIEKFRSRFGYSPESYLPVLSGRVVDSPEISDRFLWDMRRMIVEGIAYDYVGGLRDICTQNDLTLWLENYGHWGFPSEFLLYGSQSNQIGGEFWTNPVKGNIECRAAVSAAHIYGKKSIYAESFTSNRNFSDSPASLKKWCDWVFAVGINHLILHVNIHQPDEEKPGIIQWFGTSFNRHNTWFEQSKAFIDYIRRSTVMLKAGLPVVDVAYYIGEHAPLMQGPSVNELPDGYNFDYLNGDVLMNRASVKEGKICIQDGPEYAVLVLPDIPEMRPEVLKAIEKLVKEGAIIMGNKPQKSPSLQNYPECDETVGVLAGQIWGESTGKKPYGKGFVYSGTELGDVLLDINLGKDIDIRTDAEIRCAAAGSGQLGIDRNGGLVFNHRKGVDRDIYFLANTTSDPFSFEASFRAEAKNLSVWNAITGEILAVAQFSLENGRTALPMRLGEYESVFIVLDQNTQNPEHAIQVNQAFNQVHQTVMNLDADWSVKFSDFGAPEHIHFEGLSDWTAHEDSSIRNYSGTALYEKTFTFKTGPEGAQYFLKMDAVHEIATVSINGTELGTLWCPPWETDISEALIEGENRLQIEVTNPWHNRILADSKLPKELRLARVSQPYNFRGNAQPQPSGIIGSVKIIHKD